jgi:hypothetical protein
MSIPDVPGFPPFTVISGDATAPEAASPHWDDGQLAVPFSEIPALPARYLWPGVIPYRTPVMIAAPGGTGKGLLLAAITGITTRGQPFPGEAAGREPQSVIIIAPEDDANEDLAFRLAAAGADLSLVHDLTLLPDGSSFLLPDNIPELKRAITEVNAAGPPAGLVILDPLLAMCSSTLSSARAARTVIDGLQAVTRETGVAMIISHHTVKSGEIAGNKSLTDALRIVYVLGAASESERRMTSWKTNRAAAAPVRFSITGTGAGVHAVLLTQDAVLPGSRSARLRLREPGITPVPVPEKEKEEEAASSPRSLFVIAGDIIRAQPAPPAGAAPFAEKLMLVSRITDPGAASAARQFLEATACWDSPQARAIKAELAVILGETERKEPS